MEALFVMKRKIEDSKFTAMIDSGSPVPIFLRKALKEILATKGLLVRFLPQSEINVDFIQQPWTSLDLFICT